MRAYRLDQQYRRGHHGQEMMPPQYWGAVPIEFWWPTDNTAVVVYNQGGVVVKAFRANHPPVEPAVGYRIEYAGKVIVISGDTTDTPVLLERSIGADLLVRDAMNKQLVSQMEAAQRSADNNFVANIFHDIQRYHMDVSDIGKLAAQAEVKRLALTHLTPPLTVPDQVSTAFAAPVSAFYRGEVIVGSHGAKIVIP